MRITPPRLPEGNPKVPELGNLIYALRSFFQSLTSQLNGASEGRIAAATSASTQPPTAGDYAQGDFIRNSAPAELGTAGTKYVVEGWLCVKAGTPGVWVQKRFLTGN